MTDTEKKFKDLSRQIIELFSVNGPFVALKTEFDPKKSSDLILSLAKTVSDLSDVDKMYLFHGLIVYLVMLAYEFGDKAKDKKMPTACILADTMIHNLEDVCYRLFGISLEKLLLRVLLVPTVYSSDTEEKHEDFKTFEILMTADAVNRREGD